MTPFLTLFTLAQKIDQGLRTVIPDADELHAERELILDHLTKMSRSRRLAQDARQYELPADLGASADSIIARRLLREPIQYILAEAYFYGLPFVVRPGVLIPRSDTEALVELVIDAFGVGRGDRQKSDEGKFLQVDLTIGEIGAGSGIIAICLLKNIEHVRVSACDISETAVAVTLENARIHQVEGRLDLIRRDWQQWMDELPGPLDALVSNPPYIARRLRKTLEPEVALYEPDEALFDSDEDGLGFYRKFASRGASCLRSGALVFFECGDGQAAAIAAVFADNGWRSVAIKKDLNGAERVVTAVAPH